MLGEARIREEIINDVKQLTKTMNKLKIHHGE
jgi:hypothetical protein